ncbi:selenocysteine-specific translation elongation factor [Clostridium sporogenes]|uniref:selenocysteine-specific translation elongation factor n=1 Tax=Clostridium sporogenes TaxID=1509 RepID=UPI0013D37698|nr:selenocysteine-specific translation elongation factor [Clostridium sporogenes]NFV12712.1 selenocysteine-specific translation elongation factor [Clostridium sporogenes]
MNNIIIGTAGHIDHGKTTLIKALTGRETDTLREEKDRGISINLGFTFFDLPSGKRAGIVDVPGHEKFIKNMLAGVSGIDLVLMVIAADEGIMPQTKEHLEILQLLNVNKGIIVLTKTDMVDPEWLDMVKEDLREELKDTFLESADIYPVSSKTKEGIDDLIKAIDTMTENIETKDVHGHFRLPVDRVFSVTGFGTVVTGTVISGSIKEGQTVEVYPSKLVTKVRGIQVHDEPTKIAEAGQRCAINLSNIKKNDVDRGDVVSIQNLMEPSMMIDCKLYYLKSAAKPLENRQRVRLYHGTSEIICRVIILDKECLNPGEEGYVQLRLEKPITCQRNDRYVIRSYSPMVTIAGGSIIDPLPKKAKRFNEKYIEELRLKESGDTSNIIEKIIEKLSDKFPNEGDILKALGKNEENISDEIEELIRLQKIVSFSNGDKKVYTHINYIDKKVKEMVSILKEFHEKNPLKWGVSKEEIRIRVLGKDIKQKTYDKFLELLESKELIKIHGKYISEYDFNVEFNKQQMDIYDRIIASYKKGKYSPPKYEELISQEQNVIEFKRVYEAILEEGTLFKVNEDCILLTSDYNEAKEKVKKHIEDNGKITVAEFRDMMDTSRKYSLAILEHFDGIKFTKRNGDERVLY